MRRATSSAATAQVVKRPSLVADENRDTSNQAKVISEAEFLRLFAIKNIRERRAIAEIFGAGVGVLPAGLTENHLQEDLWFLGDDDIYADYTCPSTTLEKVMKGYALKNGFNPTFFDSKVYKKDQRAIVLIKVKDAANQIEEEGLHSGFAESLKLFNATPPTTSIQVLIPINTGGHWTLAEIEVTKNAAGEIVLNRNFYNSAGNGQPICDEAIKLKFQEALAAYNHSIGSSGAPRLVATELFPDPVVRDVKKQFKFPRKREDVSDTIDVACGPVACWYADKIMADRKGELGGPNDRFPQGAIDLRREQLAVLGSSAELTDEAAIYRAYQAQTRARLSRAAFMAVRDAEVAGDSFPEKTRAIQSLIANQSKPEGLGNIGEALLSILQQDGVDNFEIAQQRIERHFFHDTNSAKASLDMLDSYGTYISRQPRLAKKAKIVAENKFKVKFIQRASEDIAEIYQDAGVSDCNAAIAVAQTMMSQVAGGSYDSDEYIVNMTRDYDEENGAHASQILRDLLSTWNGRQRSEFDGSDLDFLSEVRNSLNNRLYIGETDEGVLKKIELRNIFHEIRGCSEDCFNLRDGLSVACVTRSDGVKFGVWPSLKQASQAGSQPESQLQIVFQRQTHGEKVFLVPDDEKGSVLAEIRQLIAERKESRLIEARQLAAEREELQELLTRLRSSKMGDDQEDDFSIVRANGDRVGIWRDFRFVEKLVQGSGAAAKKEKWQYVDSAQREQALNIIRAEIERREREAASPPVAPKPASSSPAFSAPNPVPRDEVDTDSDSESDSEAAEESTKQDQDSLAIAFSEKLKGSLDQCATLSEIFARLAFEKRGELGAKFELQKGAQPSGDRLFLNFLSAGFKCSIGFGSHGNPQLFTSSAEAIEVQDLVDITEKMVTDLAQRNVANNVQSHLARIAQKASSPASSNTAPQVPIPSASAAHDSTPLPDAALQPPPPASDATLQPPPPTTSDKPAGAAVAVFGSTAEVDSLSKPPLQPAPPPPPPLSPPPASSGKPTGIVPGLSGSGARAVDSAGAAVVDPVAGAASFPIAPPPAAVSSIALGASSAVGSAKVPLQPAPPPPLDTFVPKVTVVNDRSKFPGAKADSTDTAAAAKAATGKPGATQIAPPPPPPPPPPKLPGWKRADSDDERLPDSRVAATMYKVAAGDEFINLGVGRANIPNIWRSDVRANNFRVVKGVYPEDDNEGELIEKTFLKIIALAARDVGGRFINVNGEVNLEAVKKAIEIAKQKGGVAHKKKADGGWESNNDVVSDELSLDDLKKFSAKFQKHCKECGIYTGRESTSKRVGLRLTFLPESVIEKLNNVPNEDADLSAIKRKTKAKIGQTEAASASAVRGSV